MRAFRIVQRSHARTPLDGEGSFRYGGRWNSPGVRVAYLSGSAALAQLEFLVHADYSDVDLPADALRYVVASIPEGLRSETLSAADLPKGWDAWPSTQATRAIGNRWIEERRCAVLVVPSALLPPAASDERNILVNPAHPDFKRIAIEDQMRFNFDPRLVRGRPG